MRDAGSLVQAFAERAAAVALAGEPAFKLNNFMRGLSSLPLRAEPA